MSTLCMEEYVSRYCAIKHSWKGKYMRVFCIGKNGIDTINPNYIFKVTNRWDYAIGVVDVVPEPKNVTDINLITRKGSSTSQGTFSCMSPQERMYLLTDVQTFRPKFDMQCQYQNVRSIFQCRKYRCNEEYQSVSLTVTFTGIIQRNNLGEDVGVYLFQYIKGFAPVADNPNAIVIRYGKVNKMHMYIIEGRNALEFVNLCTERAQKYIGMPPYEKLATMTMQFFDMNRLGVDRERLASTAEFPVLKISPKHKDAPIRRVLATTEGCVIERDPATYNTTSAYFLQDVYALIRLEYDAQKFMIEYKDPYIVKTYTSPLRDALLAHMVDACRSMGNSNVCVLMRRVDRGRRAAPCHSYVNEEIESTLLRCLIEPAKGCGPSLMSFNEVVEFFNANVEYSGLRFTENRDGLFAENREKLIFQALIALLENFPTSDDPHVVVQQFYALRRLCVTRIGFSSAAIVPTLVKGVGAVSVRALKMHHMAVSHAVIDFLCTLMTPHHNNYDPYHEQVNKNRMLGSDSFLIHLLHLLRSHIESDSGALVILELLDFCSYSICPPYSESTEENNFMAMVGMIVEHIGKSIYLLFGHHCKAIRFSAGNIVRVILEEGNEDQFISLQRAALSEGGFLRLFHTATFVNDRPLRDLGRKLIAYWAFQNQNCQDLLRRMLPITMLHFLNSDKVPPENELEKAATHTVTAQSSTFLESKQGFFRKRFHPKDTLENPNDGEPVNVVVYRQRIVKINPMLNWALFFYELKNDHLRPDLIWNHNTRNELKEAIEAEMQAFQVGLELRKERAVCWNYQEFEVQYPSLNNELKVGNHYPRLLFESQNPIIARPKEFFNDMYHRFLLVHDFNMKTQCLHGMALLYRHYAEEIGQFNDIEYIVKMLEHATHPTFRDRMLLFIANLLNARLNVKPFIDCGGVKPLVDLLPLAHLHIDRPQIHSVTNAIEFVGSPLDLQGQEKEWHYTDKAGEKCAPVSYSELRTMLADGRLTPNSKVWAQGLGGWKDIKDVHQLKWGVLAKDHPSVLTLSDVTSTILDIFMLLCAYYPSRDPDGSVMQPLPRVKRYLSDPSILPHIVQLLLTFDPSICSRVHSLLYMLMEDNPLMPRLFLNGTFFFSLMYMGSDVLPLCRLLHLAHRKQSFRIQHDNEIIRTSVLSVLLPPALVCFLTNHGPIKFAELFLGEYETPEAIWGKDMRRYLVEKIAAHIADFTPRLLGNVRAVYQYLPIVNIEYEVLRNELFCSQYYLRHFCDELRYPDWPVRDPVALMRDCLSAWKLELEKEPSTMNKEAALEDLEIKDTPNPTPAQVRKAYFKLAAVYHPDKNPAGREKFEAIQRAYEFLASEKVISDEPDPIKIALLLKAQAILFKRFSETMSKYKYAGYGLLLKLIQMEQNDPEMLRKDPCMMDPAIELCYYTVNNAPVNADELLQEGGIDLMNSVMNRCFEQILPSSVDDENHVKIAKNCISVMGVAAIFPECRERILKYPTIPFFAAKGIAYEKAPGLSRASIHCTESLCNSPELQMAVIKYGAFWHLMQFLFRYDYTLEDSGLNVNEKNHTQLFANRAAKGALRSIYALVGFQPDTTYVKTESNIELYKLMQALLTPYIVRKMRLSPGEEDAILKLLNSNHETPYLLWNNSTRAELLDFLKNNSDTCRNAGIYSTDLPPLTTGDFTYSLHAEELIVAGIFVRVYNMQPTFQLDEPMQTFQNMIIYIENELSHIKEHQPRGVAVVMEALRNINIAYPAVYPIAQKCMPVLVSALSLRDDPDAIIKTLLMLAKVCATPQCVDAFSRISTAVADIILAIEHVGAPCYGATLQLVKQLVLDKNCVQHLLDKGLYVLLIYIFVVSRNQEIKEDACIAIAKATSDKLNGPKVALRCAKFIPIVMIETMKENPTQVCNMFDTWQENPELVWTKESQERTRDMCSKAKRSIVATLEVDKNAYWKLPEEIATDHVNDLQIGGVYLNLYVKQPGWTVRKPRDFLMAILEKFVEVCANVNRNPEILELITTVIVMFLTGQPSMTDYIVAHGCIPKISATCEADDVAVSVSALRVMHEIALSRSCVESMSGFDVIKNVMSVLRHMHDDIYLVMDTIERLMARTSEKANIVRLGILNKLPQKLLDMLESGMLTAVQPAAARAIIVKALKAMLAAGDPIYGPEIQTVLNNSAVWARYKDQSHELFLANNAAFGGFLTGPKTGGYLSLAAPPNMPMDSEPPPLDNDK